MTRPLVILLSLLAASWPISTPLAQEPGIVDPTHQPIRVVFGFSSRYFEEGDQGRVELRRITPGGAAERAGLRPGDIVTTINSSSFRFRNEWHWMRSLGWVEPGTTLDIGIRRGGESLSVALTPDAASPEQQKALADYLTRLEKQFGDSDERQADCTDQQLVEHPSSGLHQRILDAGGAAQFVLVKTDSGTLELHSNDVDVADHPIDDDTALLSFATRLEPGQAIGVHIEVTRAEPIESSISMVGPIFAWRPESAPGKVNA